MKTRGLTLIELVTAMAIFALIAVMGLQGLSGTLRARDTLSVKHEEAAVIARPIALLRNDLSSIVPLLFFPPGATPPRSSLWQSGDGSALAMSIAGQNALARNGTLRTDALHRVIWRLDDSGTLYRRSWAALNPASDTAISPEVSVMTGVIALRVRSYWPSIGWRAGVSQSPGNAPSNPDGDSATVASILSDVLPKAVEVTLVLESGGEIPILETLQ